MIDWKNLIDRLCILIIDQLIFVDLFHRSIQKQLAFMLGRQQVYLELSDEVEEYDSSID